MMPRSPTSLLVLSDTIYQFLLIVYPASYRQEYGPHMAQLFRDCCRVAQMRQGSAGILQVWLTTLGDLLVTACVQRLSSERRLWPMTSRGYLQRSGIALMLSGLLLVLYTLLTKFMPAVLPNPYFTVINPQLNQLYTLLMISVYALVALGLLSFYPRVAARTGIVGRALLILALCGPLLFIPTFYIVNFLGIEEYWAGAVIGLLMLFGGMTALGILNLREKLLMRWNALFLLIGLAGFAWGFANPDSGPSYDVQMGWLRFGFAILFSVGLLGLGYTIWTDQGEPVVQQPLANA